MILESIVTTVSTDGQVNIAPMGPVLSNADAMSSQNGGDPGFILRPFEGSRTFENLTATGCATIHVTDDASLFAKAAIGQLGAPGDRTRKTDCGRFAILKRCHRWFTVEVESIIESPPRYEMPCRMVASEWVDPFFGFNRAKHAVIEAAILATRTHLIPANEMKTQIDALRPLIEKTAGEAERAAFEMLTIEIDLRSDRDAQGRAP